MGLFDSLKKATEILGEAAEAGKKKLDELNTEENKEKLKNFLADAEKKIEEAAQNVKTSVESGSTETTSTTTTVAAGTTEDELSCEEKILKILETQFPQYTVSKDVSPRTLGGSGKFMNYSIVVSLNDKVVLAIMLIGKTTCYHREYKWSKEFAEDHDITMINFIKHYPNEPKYISERLHKYI